MTTSLQGQIVDPAADAAPVPDVAEVHVPFGSTVVVVSDFHLPGVSTATSQAAAAELARRLVDGEAPAVVVLAGDCFEMLGPEATTVAGALAAHPQLADALQSFGGRLVVVPGNHDARLAWDRAAGAELQSVGAQLALAGDWQLRIETRRGEFDAASATVSVPIRKDHQ